jgi:hypothetical protein
VVRRFGRSAGFVSNCRGKGPGTGNVTTDWTEALLGWPGLAFDCAMSRRRRLWDRYVSLLGSVFFEEDTKAIPSSYHHIMTWVAAVDDD